MPTGSIQPFVGAAVKTNCHSKVALAVLGAFALIISQRRQQRRALRVSLGLERCYTNDSRLKPSEDFSFLNPKAF